MKIVITGATGFIGSRLVRRLFDEGGWEIAALSRHPELARSRLPAGIEAAAWDPAAGPPAEKALEGSYAVVNLAGESIAAGRWTAARKQRIRDSRVITTRNLVERFKASPGARPKVLIAGSAIGYYGPRGDEQVDEESGPGSDFLAQVCQEWEREALEARKLGIRVVLLRIGVVLGKGGGALARMLLPFRLGAGGPIGGGHQWMSWIHLDDLTRMILHAIRSEKVDGPLNGTAPAPVTNREFSGILGKVLHRPAFLPMPGFALRAMVGEFADVLLTGQRVAPRAALTSGYSFIYPELEPALRSILDRS